MNDLEAFKEVFAGIKPWSGFVPQGYIADFLGVLHAAEFVPLAFPDPASLGGKYQETALPTIGRVPNDAEGWCEAVDWLISAREARDRYVMISLGANYGAQAVGACRALQTVNPLPYKLVAVDPVPQNIAWIRRHMATNGIDPDAQWIVPTAISDKVEPVLFPVSAGSGANNCYSTNHPDSRRIYAKELIERNLAAEAVENVLLNNTIGLKTELIPGSGLWGELKFVSAITLNELLGPLDTIDLLEADIQQSEILVFPPFIDLLRRKVRRIHIGTHGEDVHAELHKLFADHGWRIVFSYKPFLRCESASGHFEIKDGILTVRNPDI